MATNDFLPISKEDMEKRGWEQLDFLYISGDAYVDHPSFGHAIITRVLESKGYKVGIIAQPDWRSVDDFKRLGKPKLGILISSGNIDSMVNHYTVNKKPRSDDAYSPGGKAGYRPDRAVIVYCNRAREAYKDVPIIIGGIEASLRRFAHYDYWDDKVRRSIMVDSRADLLIYGMGEKQILSIADALNQGKKIHEITDIPGTVYVAGVPPANGDVVVIPGYEEVRADKRKYAEACRVQYEEQDPLRGRTIIQPHDNKYVVQNPPMMPLSRRELDAVYSLPYQRTYHPVYEKQGGVPAIKEVQFSVTSSRGCYGSCTFCALTFHQGRIVQSRSEASIINEVRNMTWHPDFKGYVHDVGGPTANFRNEACSKQLTSGTCKNRQCLYPTPCKNLHISHKEYLNLLRKLREIPKVKKVFIRSGIRYDYMLCDKTGDEFFRRLVREHVSGQLKVAPEHCSPGVLALMGKPSIGVFEKFSRRYFELCKEAGKEQYLVPYLMSSHPGSTLKDAVELALYLKRKGISPEQVQDFYPTPGTVSTVMFYTGIDPLTMKPVYVARDYNEKRMQRALLQYSRPENAELVRQALIKCGRRDLIGYGANCLVRPAAPERKNGRGFAEKGKKSKGGKRKKK